MTPTDVSTVGDFAAALSEGGSVKLTDNLQLAQTYNITGDVTIDLNGHTISSNQGSPLFAVSGEGAKLTLKGGTVSNRNRVAVTRNGGEVVIENGEYSSSAADVIRLENGGKATVNGGTLTGREGAIASRGNNGTIVVNGGTLVGTDNFAVATNGSDGMGGNSITINDGTLEGNIKTAGYEAIGVYVANGDTFVMNGGSIIAHGGTGLCMRAGDVTINGGSITATKVDKNGNEVSDGKIGDDPAVMTGCSAIIFDEIRNYPGQQVKLMKLTVTGGTITGVDHAIEVLSNAAEPNVFVTGGVFTPPYPEETEPVG